MKDILPEEVRRRAGKEHLGMTFSRSILASEKHILIKLVENDIRCLNKYVNRDTVEGIYQRYLTGEATDDIILLWEAASLALWLERNDPGPVVNCAGSNPSIE